MDGDSLSERKLIALTPTGFLSRVNKMFYQEYPSVILTGEVANFTTNQGKWVFFDIKDAKSSVPCFMPLWKLSQPLEDGMKVVLRGSPAIKDWGRFSVTVTKVQPVGEGSLKKAFEMLKKKLAAEGLFDASKKRGIPSDLTRLGVISSTQAAGYADFIKIINARWGGMKVFVSHTQVQGLDAPAQIIRALKRFNERGDVQMIAILRGGGSADDLSCFNDEKLVRAIAASKIPVITGVGHEVDTTLADLVADVRASTPSNAAELLTPDRNAMMNHVHDLKHRMTASVLDSIDRARTENYNKCANVGRSLLTKFIEPMRALNRSKISQVKETVISRYVEPLMTSNRSKVSRVGEGMVAKFIDPLISANRQKVVRMHEKIGAMYAAACEKFATRVKMLEALNPEKVLRQGYAILAGKASPGEIVRVTTFAHEIEAEVKKVYERK